MSLNFVISGRYTTPSTSPFQVVAGGLQLAGRYVRDFGRPALDIPLFAAVVAEDARSYMRCPQLIAERGSRSVRPRRPVRVLAW